MLIYANKTTPRLTYICDFIFKHYFGIDYAVTADADHFSKSFGAKLNYSTSSIPCRYTIRPHEVLFQQNIIDQKISCVDDEGYKAFYKTTDSQFPFDLFAAAFYLLSRYEEYLPHTKDEYGRYAHQNSLAFKEDFLQQPLVNIWLQKFAESIQQVYPELVFHRPSFNFLPTYDIDIAWSYKNKGLVKNVGGFVLRPSLERIEVLQGKEKDPYDCYNFLHEMHEQLDLKPLYFFLVADNRGRYDKNIDISNQSFKALIREHAEKYSVGLHPSWISNEEHHILLREKNYLQDQLEGLTEITSSRQHYLKFNLPDTFNNLISAGIKDDYSMGYGTINGFRASIASPFYWYDLSMDTQTALLLHPFCFMDATSAFQKKQLAQEAYAELLYYYSVCKEVNGTFITIFHNNILGGGAEFSDWPAMYKRFLAVVSQDRHGS